MGTAISETRRVQSTITLVAVAVALLLALPAVASARGFASGGCWSDSYRYQSLGVCITAITGDGRGPVSDPYSYARVTGTATWTDATQYECYVRTIAYTGRPTYFVILPDHTAHASFAMTGTKVETEQFHTTEYGDAICGPGLTTTPLDPWVMDVDWAVSDEDPINQWQLCFSPIGCASGGGTLATVVRR
jgi:hypothetical protein